MRLDSEVAGVLTQPVAVGADAQAFPLITVDADGFPHVALVSGAELAVRARDGALLVAVRGSGTRTNLERDRRGALIAVAGTVAHELKLRVVDGVHEPAASAFALLVEQHKRDTLGIALTPISFPVTRELAELEDWALSRALLGRLAEGMAP
jgi:hypothetical protein